MRGKVNRGRRHEIVSIYELTHGTDENGFDISVKTLKEQVYAEVRTVSTKEYLAAMQPSFVTEINKFVMPYLDYLTTGAEIEWNNKAWNIQHIHIIDKWNMEVTAKYVS